MGTRRTRSASPKGQEAPPDSVLVVPEPEGPSMSPAGAEAHAGAETVGLTEPRPLTDEQLSAALAPAAGARPTLAPPAGAGATGAEAVTGITATWRVSMTVSALWSINEIRNAWMLVGGLGWRKIYNGRDGAFTALVTLASQARQTGRPITFREEADGMVYEIYLW